MYETTLLSDQQKVDCKKKGRAQHHISSSTEFCVFLGTGGESSVHPRSLLMLAGDIEKNPGPNRESVSLNSEMRLDSLDNRTVGGGRNFSVDINEESLSVMSKILLRPTQLSHRRMNSSHEKKKRR